MNFGDMTRVKPNQLHGATVGPTGGTFISIQYWLNGVKPTSVGLDWEGIPLGENHKRALKW